MNNKKVKKLTTKYRDKYRKEANIFIDEYANENIDKGSLYYIYSKDSNENDIYNVKICEDSKSHEIIQINKENLPEDVKINTAIRLYQEKYVIDEDATKEITEQLEDIIEKIILEQEEDLKEHRIEGHIYVVDEVENDRVWIYDISLDDNNGVEVIEETTISEEIRLQIKQGSKLIFKDGKYQLYY